ncbi:MAG TPA: VWA domain-containing protein [Gaiellaceae bacterium]|nr:VWA domain-containing protein [Gaiellaceae bacterium]
MTEPVAILTGFSRSLRDEGLPVGTGRIVRFCRAAALLEPRDLYWAGRTTLVSRRQDLPVYDRVFATFFGDSRAAMAESAVRVRVTAELAPEVELALASPLELLRHKSFADCSSDELQQLAALMARVSLAVPLRRSRRRTGARRGAPDLRRTLRRSFRTAGEPVERAWRERRLQPRRLVLLLDVSGSMADYSRALVMFAHAALRANPRWEAFCFGTRLTRVTRALRTADHDEALRRAAGEVVDWDGGTRIGESLKRFLDDFGHGGLARGAVVVFCSDGLEVGDPDLLAEQMARLSRLAHRVVWLNPLQEDPAYEPLARGMKAALPFVDDFAAGHNLASLEAVAERLARTAA